MSTQGKGKKNRKQGRNAKSCSAYEMEGRLERNKRRKQARQLEKKYRRAGYAFLITSRG